MDLIGRMLASRYELLEKIGHGGMATVYKTKDHVLNRFVAVNVLKDLDLKHKLQLVLLIQI